MKGFIAGIVATLLVGTLFAAPVFVQADALGGPWSEWTRDPITYFTFWIALFTAALALSTVLLWQETKRAAQATQGSVDELRRQFNASYRARIIVRNLAVVGNFEDSLKLAFIVANIGDTECVVTEFYAGAVIGEKGPPGVLRFDDPPPMSEGTLPSPVAAGAAFPVRAQLASLPWEEAQQIKARTRILFVYGYVGYRDGNGVMRRTGFLRQFDPGGGGFSITNNPDYEYQD